MEKIVFRPSEKSVSGAALKKNIMNWMVSAYRDNPGIISHLQGYKGGCRPVPTKDDKKLVIWYNEFAGKLLFGMAQSYAAMPCDELLEAGNTLCRAIADAQCDDGYTGIYGENERFGGDGDNWDVWGHYHIISGLLLWYENTGYSPAHEAAVKAAECVWQYFSGSGRKYLSATNPTMNFAISHVFAQIYEKFGVGKYLDAAKDIVDNEWQNAGNWMNEALSGLDFYRSSLPRWEALHTVMTLARLYGITGNDRYFKALDAIWHSIYRTDVHNTGGFSSGEKASGDPFDGGDIETCCSVAWSALTTEYLGVSKNVEAADALERCHYNALLGSLMPDGRHITYSTPMWGEARYSSQHIIGFQYNSASKEFNCCQANCARALSQFSAWAVMADGDGCYVNMYCRGVAVGDGISIEMETDYPISGRVTALISAQGNKTVYFRIPSWASGTRITVGGNVVTAKSGEYFPVAVKGDGCRVEIDIPMEIYAEKGGGQLEGAVSLYRGPVLLTSDNTGEAAMTARLPHDPEKIKNAPVAKDTEHYLKVLYGDAVLYDFASCGRDVAYTSWHREQM